VTAPPHPLLVFGLPLVKHRLLQLFTPAQNHLSGTGRQAWGQLVLLIYPDLGELAVPAVNRVKECLQRDITSLRTMQ